MLKPSNSNAAIDPSKIPALDLPATFANQFHVVVGTQLTRIAFGEFLAGDPAKYTFYHLAIQMPTESALEMARSIIAIYGNAQPVGDLNA